jgi:hypothetical protein
MEDSLAIGVDRIQRNLAPLKQQVEQSRGDAVVHGCGETADLPGVHRGGDCFPKHLARRVHEL